MLRFSYEGGLNIFTVFNFIYTVGVLSLPLCSFMNRHKATGDVNTQNYEKVLSSTTNLNVKIMLSCTVTVLDLSKKSSVNEGNTTAHYFSVKILQVPTL